MSLAAILTLALLLDACLGEPRWLWSRVPHPIVLIGQTIGWAERRVNTRTCISGVIFAVVLVFCAAVTGWCLSQLGWVVEMLVAAILFAQKSLVMHVQAVASGLRQSLQAGRSAVAMIVSRDTSAMTKPDVARAAIESAAENLSDGVVAPVFWFAIAGLPGLIVYKAVNTADSMVGYRTERYAAFGWASARSDDVLNLIPARLCGAMIWLANGCKGQWRDIATEAQRHKSPNAGWPEAAMARALNVALAGPRSYHGEIQDLPWVNPGGKRDIGATEIEASVSQLWRIWLLLVILGGIFSVL